MSFPIPIQLTGDAAYIVENIEVIKPRVPTSGISGIVALSGEHLLGRGNIGARGDGIHFGDLWPGLNGT